MTFAEKTPIYAWHRAQGARMVDFGGWDMPVQYPTGILKEHLATRRHGGVFDVSHMGRFHISGSGAVPFLQRMLTNDAKALAPWSAHYTLLANEAGGVIDDAFLYHMDTDSYMLVVNASNRIKDWDHLSSGIRSFPSAHMEDLTYRLSMIAVQGPDSEWLVEGLMESGRLPGQRHGSISEMTLTGAPVRAARTGYTGEPVGLELFVPCEKAVALWECICEAGVKMGIAPVGLGARDTLRLEAGMPLYGHEFGACPDGGEFPAFAFPLTSIAVSFAPGRGDFIGRGALERQARSIEKTDSACRQRDTLFRRIRRLAILDRGVARQGDEVMAAGRRAGTITSGTTVPCWVFREKDGRLAPTDETALRSIAMAYVDPALQPGDDALVSVRQKHIKARLVKSHGDSRTPPWFIPFTHERT